MCINMAIEQLKNILLFFETLEKMELKMHLFPPKKLLLKWI